MDVELLVCMGSEKMNYHDSLKSKVKQGPPIEPIALRIVMTEEHQWMRVSNHLQQCPGNGCSVDMCLYIRQLCEHDMDDCDIECKWCSKIQRWLKYHLNFCGPKKCPYSHMFSEVQKKVFKRNMRRYSDPIKVRRKSSSPITRGYSSPPSVTFDGRKLVDNIPEADDDSCCQDPLSPDSSDILKGSFTEKLEEVYQMALREELPVSELKVQENIDIKTSMRLALISQLKQDKCYQEGRHWKRIRQIGFGGSGTTFCIQDLQSDFCLALKEEQDTNDAVEETYISLHISSITKDHPPNIVEFYGASLLPSLSVADSTKLQIFLELMPCCLQSYMFNGGPLSIEDSHNYACQLFEALDFLHRRINIVHSDIKPGNLLIDENIQRIKVADFGCAQILEDYHQGYCMRGDAKAGTLHYNPPEHYTEYRCSYSLDMWQAGCCLVAMVTGRRPWRAMYPDCKDRRPDVRAYIQHYQREMIAQTSESQQRHPIPGFLDKAMMQLLSQCLNPDYTNRPTPQQCLTLLAHSDIVSEESRGKWLYQLGMSPSLVTPPQSCHLSHSSLIDVYLGSHFQCTHPVHCCMLPGWLGSISCDDHMTYEQLYRIIPDEIPITKHFTRFEIRISENLPQMIWEKSQIDSVVSTSNDIQSLHKPHSTDTVDTSKAVILIVL